MEKVRIAAGIVLYNPEIERLRQNIEAIIGQVDELYLVNNGSNNDVPLQPLYAMLQKHNTYTQVISNSENQGIAHALNQLLQTGKERKMDWVLTLDQDSVCPKDFIEQLLPYAQNSKHECERTGILCPVIHDRSFGIEQSPDQTTPTTQVKECITSGSLTNVNAWIDAGRFDDRLFIDAVDTDFCLSLQEHGWKVIQINSIQLQHEIGHHATQHIVCGRSYIAFNHTPIRYYYIARNMVFLSRKHPNFLKPAPWRCMLTMLGRMLTIMLWEDKQKLTKCKMVLKGIRDGIKFPNSETIDFRNNRDE